MKIHVFATILALYPFTKTEEIAEEFEMPVYKIREMARICRVKKSDDYLYEVYLQNSRKATERNTVRRKRREQRAIKLWNEGVSMGEIARRLKLSKSTVYKYLLKSKKNEKVKK
jgi:DNA invertase Pin-like site-specific DNA recombinase